MTLRELQNGLVRHNDPVKRGKLLISGLTPPSKGVDLPRQNDAGLRNAVDTVEDHRFVSAGGGGGGGTKFIHKTQCH